MDNGAFQQGQRDANRNEPAKNMKNADWKTRQDYETGYSAAKNKPR